MFQEHCVVFFYFLKYFEIVDTIVLRQALVNMSIISDKLILFLELMLWKHMKKSSKSSLKMMNFMHQDCCDDLIRFMCFTNV